jgi:NADPH-dependent 2,4-dienoyl-CoA reductase/sulfur reductase-like enzyme
MDSVVIVGASLSGVRTADALRSNGFAGDITIIGAESEFPYDRPPLSKQYLSGQSDHERILLRSPESYVHDRIDLLRGRVAVSVNVETDKAVVSLSDGSQVSADALVIATGTRPRKLDIQITHTHTYDLRTRADADSLRTFLVDGARVVIVGAGFIGGEVASTAHALGCTVTIVEAAPVPLSRQLGDVMGAACAGLHEKNGVALRTAVTVTRIDHDGVHLPDGTVLPADVVVTGVGVTPNVEWLQNSGIAIGVPGPTDGVHCDETLRVHTESTTTEPGRVLDNVVAVGDIARFPHALFDEEMRIEHWTNAVETATHAAATLLGAREPFAPVPYFWSDQYGRKIQFLGRATNADEVVVVEGSIAEGSWLALYRRGDRFVGALGVSKIRALMQIRPYLARGATWNEVFPVRSPNV